MFGWKTSKLGSSNIVFSGQVTTLERLLVSLPGLLIRAVCTSEPNRTSRLLRSHGTASRSQHSPTTITIEDLYILTAQSCQASRSQSSLVPPESTEKPRKVTRHHLSPSARHRYAAQSIQLDVIVQQESGPMSAYHDDTGLLDAYIAHYGRSPARRDARQRKRSVSEKKPTAFILSSSERGDVYTVELPFPQPRPCTTTIISPVQRPSARVLRDEPGMHATTHLRRCELKRAWAWSSRSSWPGSR